MLRGSPSMLGDLRIMFEERDFIEGSGSKPGHFGDREGARRALRQPETTKIHCTGKPTLRRGLWSSRALFAFCND